jgi:hypothetical protein
MFNVAFVLRTRVVDHYAACISDASLRRGISDAPPRDSASVTREMRFLHERHSAAVTTRATCTLSQQDVRILSFYPY